MPKKKIIQIKKGAKRVRKKPVTPKTNIDLQELKYAPVQKDRPVGIPFHFIVISPDECINLTNVESLNLLEDLPDGKYFGIRFFFSNISSKDMRFKTKEQRTAFLKSIYINEDMLSVVQILRHNAPQRTRKFVRTNDSFEEMVK